MEARVPQADPVQPIERPQEVILVFQSQYSFVGHCWLTLIPLAVLSSVVRGGFDVLRRRFVAVVFGTLGRERES